MENESILSVMSPETHYTVRNLKEGGYYVAKEAFSNWEEAIEILNYLDFIASNNNSCADNIVLPYRIGSKGNIWIVSRPEAVDMFFSHLETAKANKCGSQAFTDEDIARLKRALENRRERTLSNMNDVYENIMYEATSYQDKSIQKLNLAAAEMRKIDAIRDFEIDPALYIRGIEETNWMFHSTGETSIKFVSRSDIILKHVDAAAGLHYELNCGKFLLVIDENNIPKIYAYERCVDDGCLTKYNHPHVRRDGNICFGNASDASKKAIATGDIVALMKILDNMLPHYNSSSPYITIRDFAKSVKERDRLLAEKIISAKAKETYENEEEEVAEEFSDENSQDAEEGDEDDFIE